MAYDYGPLKAKAAELIAKYGAVIKVQREGSTATWTRKFDVQQSRTYWEDAEENVVYDPPDEVVILATGNAIVSEWPKSLIANGVVEVEDVRVLVVVDVDVHNGDVLIFASGHEYQVVPPVRKVSPDGITVLVQEVNARG